MLIDHNGRFNRAAIMAKAHQSSASPGCAVIRAASATGSRMRGASRVHGPADGGVHVAKSSERRPSGAAGSGRGGGVIRHSEERFERSPALLRAKSYRLSALQKNGPLRRAVLLRESLSRSLLLFAHKKRLGDGARLHISSHIWHAGCID